VETRQTVHLAPGAMITSSRWHRVIFIVHKISILLVMVYIEVLTFVAAAAIVFITMYVMTPFLYTIWHGSGMLSDQVKNSTQVSQTQLRVAGDNLYNAWKIMNYVVPGIIIAWGFATAARAGTQEQVDGGY